MKKTYIKPQAQAVSLFTEEALLSVSNPKSYEVSADTETNDVFSSETGWSSNDWSAADED